MYTLSVYIAGEIDLFENLDKVHITLLVEGGLALKANRLLCHSSLGSRVVMKREEVG